VRAETCSDVAFVIYTRKEVVAKDAIITVFITVFICTYEAQRQVKTTDTTSRQRGRPASTSRTHRPLLTPQKNYFSASGTHFC
jgi:hypothetical protein